MDSTDTNPPSTWITRELVITNELGVHGRPAAMISKITDRYAAKVLIAAPNGFWLDGETVGESGGYRTVDAGSVMALMSLAMGPGDSIRILAQGPDAQEVVDELVALITERFDEY